MNRGEMEALLNEIRDWADELWGPMLVIVAVLLFCLVIAVFG